MAIEIKQLPGPKGMPILKNLTKIDLPNYHRQVEEWADEFGDVFYLDLAIGGQLVVTRPSLINKIANERPDTFLRVQKMSEIIRDGGVHGVFNAEGEEWKRHRSVVTKGLDVKHQQRFYPALVNKVEKLYQRWSDATDVGEEIYIQKDLLRFTVDVTSSLAFGYDINTLEQEGGVIQDQLEKIFPTIFKRINMAIPWYKLIKSKADKEYDDAVRVMKETVSVFIEETREKIKQNPDLKEHPTNLIESIIVAAEEEGAFTMEEVRGNLMTLLMAGEDTTALTLTWLIHLLLNETDVQDKIRTEVDTVLGDSPWIRDYKLNSQLKYIEAAAFEALRFKPVAPMILHEAVKDIELEGIRIPKGQHVLTQYRHAALKDDHFSEAERFYPERWLKESRCPVHNTEAFTPFGAGPRYCPGRNLAILEIRAVMAMLFKNFTIEAVPGYEVNEIMAFTMTPTEYRVRLKKR